VSVFFQPTVGGHGAGVLIPGRVCDLTIALVTTTTILLNANVRDVPGKEASEEIMGFN